MNKKLIGLSVILFLLSSLLGFINNVYADETTIYVGADAFVRDDYPDNNYGYDNNLFLFTQVDKNYRVILKFDLGGLDGGLTVESATLRLDCWYVNNLVGGVTDVEVHRVSNDSWVEGGVTWGNQPSYGVVEDVQIPFVGWVEWNITDFVIDEYGGDDVVSVLLKNEVEDYDGTLRRSQYYSSEYDSGSVKPELVVVLGSGDNSPFYSNVGDDGVTQVGEDVTVSCYWQDDFELNWTVVSHNSTGSYVNFTVSCSGNASWSNKTFQLNYTSDIKVGYLFYGQDNASQWNYTSINYITTTPLYLTFNLNNSTQGRFYVDLGYTVNETQNDYNYNQTVFLLGATYNKNYTWCNFTDSETTVTENFYDYQTNGNKTVWCNFDVCNATGSGNGYNETDLHEHFILGVIIAVIVSFSFIIIMDKKDLIRGR